MKWFEAIAILLVGTLVVFLLGLGLLTLAAKGLTNLLGGLR